MSKDAVRAQFGANAANYVASPVHAKGKSLARLVEAVAPRADWHALDIATAAGHTAFAFAPHVAHVVASDLTPEMLDQARALAAEKQITNVSFAEADAEALPFEDATFDLVTCRIAPHHFPDVAAFVREAARVLKPGGRFGLVDNLAPDATTNPDLTADAAHQSAVAYNAFEKRRDPSHGRALAYAEWIAIVEAAHLAIQSTELLDKAMRFERWCATMSVAPDLKESLRADVTKAGSPLAAFIRPEPIDGGADVAFTLTELVLVADKAPTTS
ncbi:MAG: methyltransferase domain-containing protein [Pseudomonadota bacterium]